MAQDNKDIAAEQCVLGCILLEPTAIFQVIDILKPEYFFEQKHRFIYEACLRLCDENKAIDMVTLASTLKSEKKLGAIGGGNYIKQLPNTIMVSTHVKSYAQIVVEVSKKRFFQQFAVDLKIKVDNNKSTIKSILEFIDERMLSLADYKSGVDIVLLKAVAMQVYANLENGDLDERLRGISTGFQGLDNILSGFHKTDLIIVAGRPGMGKTSLALNFMTAAAKDKKNILFFSLEMSAEQLADRLVSCEAGVNFWNIRTGLMGTENLAKIKQTISDMGDWNFFLTDKADLSITDIRSAARKFAIRQDIDMIVVDYLQLSKVNTRANRVGEISEVSKGLKMLAKELNVPVIALSQLSRPHKDVKDKRPQLHELKDSGSIEADADVVLMLHREDYYNPDHEVKDILEVAVRKHRNGESNKTIYLHFDGQTQRYAQHDEYTPPHNKNYKTSYEEFLNE